MNSILCQTTLGLFQEYNFNLIILRIFLIISLFFLLLLYYFWNVYGYVFRNEKHAHHRKVYFFQFNFLIN